MSDTYELDDEGSKLEISSGWLVDRHVAVISIEEPSNAITILPRDVPAVVAALCSAAQVDSVLINRQELERLQELAGILEAFLSQDNSAPITVSPERVCEVLFGKPEPDCGDNCTKHATCNSISAEQVRQVQG